MDIRTKLILSLVTVALLSMIAFGGFISRRVAGDLREARLDELGELAASKGESLRWIIEGWKDRTELVGSRTQLRINVDRVTRLGDASAEAAIERILRDALGASETLTLLRIHDVDGEHVSSVTRGTDAVLPARGASLDTMTVRETGYAGVEFVGGGVPQVSFTTPMALQGRAVGVLLAVYQAQELLELTGHYHSLGETGEVMIVAEDADGAPRTLHSVRHGATGDGVSLEGGDDSLARRALTGDSVRVWPRALDYREQTVWAATGPVEETGWGLVVKIDEVEELADIVEFRAWLRRAAVVLAAFAILAGLLLGLRFALPIQELAAVADRIREGEMDARAVVQQEDEVGVLARTFNLMADELEDRMSLLREFRKFFDVSIDLMCIAGTDGYFRRVNQAFGRTLGWTDEELLSRPFIDFVHPDDIESTQAEVAKLAEGIPTISFENRYQCADGSYKRLRWATYPEDGVLYAIAHVMGDASAA